MFDHSIFWDITRSLSLSLSFHSSHKRQPVTVSCTLDNSVKQQPCLKLVVVFHFHPNAVQEARVSFLHYLLLLVKDFLFILHQENSVSGPSVVFPFAPSTLMLFQKPPFPDAPQKKQNIFRLLQHVRITSQIWHQYTK